jgi:hypothetical protein
MIRGTVSARIVGDGIASAGDRDHDGRADLAIVVEQADYTGGRIEICSSATGERLVRLPEAGDRRGGRFCNVGDVDGDLADDLAIAAVPHGGYGHYDVRIQSGADGNVLRTLPGLFDGAKSGDVVAIGDCDGDGTGDLFVTEYAPLWWGIARILSGRDGSTLMQVDSAPYAEKNWADLLGYSVARIGDADGDGASDVVVGCCNPWSDQAGWVQVCSGRTGVPRFAVDQRVVDETK